MFVDKPCESPNCRDDERVVSLFFKIATQVQVFLRVIKIKNKFIANYFVFLHAYNCFTVNNTKTTRKYETIRICILLSNHLICEL